MDPRLGLRVSAQQAVLVGFDSQGLLARTSIGGTRAEPVTLSRTLTHTGFRMRLHPRAGNWPGYYCRRSLFAPRREAGRATLSPAVRSPFTSLSPSFSRVQACAMRTLPDWLRPSTRIDITTTKSSGVRASYPPPAPLSLSRTVLLSRRSLLLAGPSALPTSPYLPTQLHPSLLFLVFFRESPRR